MEISEIRGFLEVDLPLENGNNGHILPFSLELLIRRLGVRLLPGVLHLFKQAWCYRIL